MPKRFTDDEFISAWHQAKGSPVIMSKMIGMSERAIYKRRKEITGKGIELRTVAITPQGQANSIWKDAGRAYKRQNDLSIEDGNIIVFSDAHFWPDQPKTLSHLALLELIKDLKPKVVVANGDIFDGARVSRHAPMGWVKTPTVKEELDICDEYLHEIRLAANPKQCAFFWNMGNHDQRFDRMLAQNSAEFEGVLSRLEDRFSDWDFAWSLAVNENVMIKHRFQSSGIHAGYNATLKGGVTTVSGHTHLLEVKPWADYNGRRWGVQTGSLADQLNAQFEYQENNPSPSCQGFAVLSFRDGILAPPELCEVIGNGAYFRGQEIVSKKG